MPRKPERPPARGLRVERFRLVGEEFAVVSFPLDVESDALTPAEREVATLAVAGKSNAEIARACGTALRTVANQLASLFRKLRVGSRAELAAAVARSPGDERE
jgi:DNA-binding CsgD family transcriptional regulator